MHVENTFKESKSTSYHYLSLYKNVYTEGYSKLTEWIDAVNILVRFEPTTSTTSPSTTPDIDTIVQQRYSVFVDSLCYCKYLPITKIFLDDYL